MNENDSVELGKTLWLMLSSSFHQVAADNKLDYAAKGRLWAGFLAAAAGEMTADVGREVSNALLVTINEGCQEATKAPGRPNLKVVKP